MLKSPAGIREDNSVTATNCDNSHASTPASFLDNLGVDSTSENPAGTPENNNVTAANCDNPCASTPTSSLDNSNSSGALSQLLANDTPQVTAAKRPTAGTPENNNVTAANCDNPRASTPTSSLDNSKSSALSQLLADHTPKVTPIAAAKRPKARLLTSADCLRMLEEKQAKKKKEAEEKEQRRKDREEKRNIEKKKQKEKLKKSKESSKES